MIDHGGHCSDDAQPTAVVNHAKLYQTALASRYAMTIGNFAETFMIEMESFDDVESLRFQMVEAIRSIPNPKRYPSPTLPVETPGRKAD